MGGIKDLTAGEICRHVIGGIRSGDCAEQLGENARVDSAVLFRGHDSVGGKFEVQALCRQLENAVGLGRPGTDFELIDGLDGQRFQKKKG